MPCIVLQAAVGGSQTVPKKTIWFIRQLMRCCIRFRQRYRAPASAAMQVLSICMQ